MKNIYQNFYRIMIFNASALLECKDLFTGVQRLVSSLEKTVLSID